MFLEPQEPLYRLRFRPTSYHGLLGPSVTCSVILHKFLTIPVFSCFLDRTSLKITGLDRPPHPSLSLNDEFGILQRKTQLLLHDLDLPSRSTYCDISIIYGDLTR